MKNKHILLLLSGLLMGISIHAQVSFTNQTSLLHDPTGFTSGVAVAVADMDGDGKDDVVRLDNGNFLHIEYQQGSGQPFVHAPVFYGPEEAWAMAVADVNNDGLGDVMFGGYYDGVKLVRSVNGNYQATVMPGPNLFVQGSNFADINNDGWLDAFNCDDNAESRIWGNNGSGNFFMASDWIDMATVPPSDNSGNYGSTWTDFDGDGDLDLYIAKCRQGVNNPNDPRRINALFVNDGAGNYYEDAASYGLKIGHQSWAADFQDIDNDGDLDCLIANHDYPLQLLENDGSGHFTDISAASGVGSFSGGFLQCLLRDFDNDGFVDIITAAPTYLLRNNGNNTFSPVSTPFAAARSFAVGDLNHDGFIDLYTAYQCNYTTPCGQPDQLWMNDGNTNHYLAVRLQGNQSNRQGVGARVIIEGSWGTQVREIRAGESYGISNSLTAFFGLGSATSITSVAVHWPSGQIDVVDNPAIDQYLLIEESMLCALADAHPSNGGFACANGSTEFNLTLCNQGFDVLPAGLPIAFYKNDPRQPGAVLLAVGQTDEAVFPGSCEGFSFPLNAEPGTLVFAVANDDGSAPLPYSQPNGPVDECDLVNNFISRTFTYQPPPLDLGSDLGLCNLPSHTFDAGPSFHSYQWQDGSSGQTFTASASGTFWVNVVDVCGISQSDAVELELTQAPPVNLGDDRHICESESTTLHATGYETVQWSPSAGLSCNACPSPIASPAATTTYQVTVTQAACTFTDNIQVVVNAPPAVSLTAEDSGCTSPASISASANGNGPFGYAWSSGETTAEINPTQSGTYHVSVTDGNGCQMVDSASVTVLLPIEITLTPSPVSCPNGSDGMIDLIDLGPSGPLSFLWSNGETTEDLSGLPPGPYSTTVTDANGCTTSASTTVAGPAPIAVQMTVDAIPCAGGNGSIFTTPTGGTGPYGFAWSNGSFSQNLQSVPNGNYSLTVTDANGCAEIFTQNLPEPTAVAVGFSESAVLCHNGAGSVFTSVTGGTGPFGYLWSNGSTTQHLEDVPAGNYSLTVTDANGCAKTGSFELIEPTPISAQANIQNPACAGGTGSLSVAVSGGTPPYQYLWDTGDTTHTLTGIPAGLRMIEITDANGCVFNYTIILVEPLPLTVGATASPIDCSQPDPLGTATLIPQGGMPPYSVVWENGSTGTSLSVATPGEYLATVTDALGCTKTAAATVGLSENLLLDVTPGLISCHPDSGPDDDGSLSIQPSSGRAPFSFLWENGETGSLLSGLSSGIYAFTVTDVVGCSKVDSFGLDTPLAFIANTWATPEMLCHDGLAFGYVNADGGTAPPVFLWSNGSSQAVLPSIPAGVYSVTATDQHGCTATSTLDIPGSPPMEIVLDSILPASSPTSADGAVWLENVLGGTPPLSFLWNNGATTSALVNVLPGTYGLTVTDAFGCTEWAVFTVDFIVGTGEMGRPDWEVRLFPNPVQAGEMTLQVTSAAAGPLDLACLDLAGRLVFSKKTKLLAGRNELLLDVSALASGTYYLHLRGGDGRGTAVRFVVAGW